jgi:hypothetical protein
MRAAGLLFGSSAVEKFPSLTGQDRGSPPAKERPVTTRSFKRIHKAELYVDRDARPGWPTGAERTPTVGEEVYCAGGEGEISAVLGKTGDGSRLVEIRLADPGAKPFFAAASNVLVAPGAKKEKATRKTAKTSKAKAKAAKD